MHPAEQVGIRYAHIVLADLTQDSLSSFHNAGNLSGGNSQGLQDIIDGTSTRSGMTIKSKHAEKIKRDILYRPLKYYVMSITNSILEQFEDGNFWYTIGRDLGKLPGPSDIPPESVIIIRFYLDYQRLKKDCRTLGYVVRNIFCNYDHVYHSPDFMGIIDVHISNLIELSSIVSLIDETFGVEGVTSCDITSDVLVTTGSSLHEVCTHKYVDPTTVISNDIYDVELTFGLEAAREVIYSEVLAKCGNKKSSSFIADFMTCKGYVSAFKKDNPMLKDKGFLASIAFERPKKDIKGILDTGEKIDVTSSVYSQLVTGSLPDAGTGSKLFTIT
jgi:hypothetical protein